MSLLVLNREVAQQVEHNTLNVEVMGSNPVLPETCYLTSIRKIMEPVIKIYVISNPRTPEGGWADHRGCNICGQVSSAYVGIQEKGNNMAMSICKGCLLNAVKLIDKDLLDQAKQK